MCGGKQAGRGLRALAFVLLLYGTAAVVTAAEEAAGSNRVLKAAVRAAGFQPKNDWLLTLDDAELGAVRRTLLASLSTVDAQILARQAGAQHAAADREEANVRSWATAAAKQRATAEAAEAELATADAVAAASEFKIANKRQAPSMALEHEVRAMLRKGYAVQVTHDGLKTARSLFKNALAKLRKAKVKEHVLLAQVHVALGHVLTKMKLRASGAKQHELGHRVAASALRRERESEWREMEDEHGEVDEEDLAAAEEAVAVCSGKPGELRPYLHGCAAKLWERVTGKVQAALAVPASSCAASPADNNRSAVVAPSCWAAEGTGSVNVSPHPSIDVFRLPRLLQSLPGKAVGGRGEGWGKPMGAHFAAALRALVDTHIKAARSRDVGRSWCFERGQQKYQRTINALHKAGKLSVGWEDLRVTGDERCTTNLSAEQMTEFDRQLTKLLTGPDPPLAMSTSLASSPGLLPVLDGMMGELESRLGMEGYAPGGIQLLRYELGQFSADHTDCDPFIAIEESGTGERFTSATEAAVKRKPDRAATMLVYLNGGAAIQGASSAAPPAPLLEGGETVFPLLNVTIAPSEGLVLVFNNIKEGGFCNPRSMHRAESPTRGTKYVVQKWYFDGKVRHRRNPKVDRVKCDSSHSCREYVMLDAPVSTSVNLPQLNRATFTDFHHVVLERAFQDVLCPPRGQRVTGYPSLVSDCDDVIATSLEERPGGGLQIGIEFRWNQLASAQQYASMANALTNMDGAFVMQYYAALLKQPPNDLRP